MKKWLLGLCFVALAIGTYSAELSIEDAFELAEKQNLTIQKEKIKIENSKKDLEMTKDKLLPGLSASSNFNTGGEQEDSFSHQISSNYTIYDGGEKKNNVEMAKKNIEAADLNIDQVIKSTKLQIVSQYSQALKYMKNLEVYKKQLDEQQKEYDKIKLKYDNKAASKSELLILESNMFDTEANIIQAENNYLIAIENLKNLIKMSEEIELVEPNIELSEVNVDSDINKAVEYNADIREYTMNIELAEISVKNSKTEYYPDVDLSFSYSSADEDLGDSLTDWDWRAGISVSYNVFDWGTKKDSLEKQNNILKQRKIELEEKKDNIELELKSKYFEVVKIRQLINAQEKKIESLSENLKIDKVKYDNKALDINDYLESQNDYWDAEIYLESLYLDYYVAKYEYFDLMN